MVRTNTSKHLRKAAVLAFGVVLATAAPASAVTWQHFNAGSLIIPMEGPFQDPCGTVSAYGLIYKTLAASEAQLAKGLPGVTVHWLYKDTSTGNGKNSPNRCVPTNLSPTPQTSKSCPYPYDKCTVAPWKDPNWNDGCDFSITSTISSAPVTLIDNTTTTAAPLVSAVNCSKADGTFCTRNTGGGADAALSYPTFASVTVAPPVKNGPNVSTVQYMGGTFVIEAADAPTFLALLAGSSVNDLYGNPVDFSTFRNKADIGQCQYSAPSGGVVQFTKGYANTHWVNIHRASVGFDAIDSKKMSQAPGKIALLQTAGGTSGTLSGTPGGVVGDMLPRYLKSAGLDFPTAQGCPAGGYNAKNALTNCPNGPVSGRIFDAFDVLDLQNPTLLTQTFTASDGSVRPVYSNFWAPHWEGVTFTGCDGTCINNARKTIAAYATGSSKVGVLAECASIGVIEGAQGTGAFDANAALNRNPGGWWYPPKQLNGTVYSDPAAGYTSPFNAGEAPAKIVTCAETTPGSGICAATDTGSAAMRGTLHDVDTPGNIIGLARLRNCTDPNLAAGSNCMYFGNPGSPYAQIGDYLWFSEVGLVANFKPHSGDTLRNPNNTSHLGFTIAGVKNPGPSLTLSAALTQNMADNVDLLKVPLGSNSSQILYLGGHSFSGDVSGTRIVLNTMLAVSVAAKSAAETGYIGATPYNGDAFVPTYDAVTQLDAPPEWRSFTLGAEEQWRFPNHTGHLRAHPLTGSSALVADAKNAFTSTLDFTSGTGGAPDAAARLPAAADRNIFTYLGGGLSVDADPLHPKKPNGVVQQGWQPTDIDYDSVDPAKGCVDNFHIGEMNSTVNPAFSGTPYATMLPGGDGVCDLQEALQLSRVSPLFVDVNGEPDHGTTNGVKGGSVPAQFKSELDRARGFAQLVRGFCWSTDSTGKVNKHPDPSQVNSTPSVCDGIREGYRIQDDTPGLGGFVHSQAAIVPASPFIADSPAGTHRPTVAYVGGLDGMLHAFYVPSDGLDLGYTGPASPVKAWGNPDASNVFHKGFASFTWTKDKALTELWAFVPPGQLPLLQSNNAMVDSSPVVIDAYGDFDGSGVRSWHTVLVASAGGGNREIFALDVTNPVKPILIWDLQASFMDQAGVQFAPTPLTDDDTAKNTSTQAQAFSWHNVCRADADPANCTVSDFRLPPQGNPNRTGLYNYGNLGASQSISVAQMRRFNSPVFAAFVATNEPQDKSDLGSGLFVFAIDVTNGQKLWEFNNAYTPAVSPTPLTDQDNASAGNTPPAGVTLLSKAGNSIIDTAYVGDDEGALWELDAADGVNVNSFAPLLTSSQYGSLCSNPNGQHCNFALSQGYGDGRFKSQPISSLSTIFILPPLPATSPLKPYEGQPMLAYGTGGTDTVSSLEPAPDTITGAFCSTGPCITGRVHVVPLEPGYRYTPADFVGTTTVPAQIANWGMLKPQVATPDNPWNEPPGYPLKLKDGERVFGSIVAAGDQLFFNTTIGGSSSIDGRQGNLSGSTYRLLLSATTNAPYDYVAAAGLTKVGGAGGTPMLDAKTGAVVVVTDSTILRFNPAPGGTLVGPSVNGRGSTPTGLLSWFFRRRGLEY